MTLAFVNARALTLARGPRPRRRQHLADLAVLPNACVVVRDGFILSADLNPPPDNARVIDAQGRVLMPAFVDAHTHACWAGSRLDEWERKLAGASYQDIMNAGGGIMSTVRATRDATPRLLADRLTLHLRLMLREGTASAEVKSGYGLTPEHELKMLDAITLASHDWPGTLLPTALLGHAVEGDPRTFVDDTIARTLPAVSSRFPGITVDAYCEKGAWSLDDCLRLFRAAQLAGHPFRVHADQFSSLGMTPHAAALGARSVDHLEASTRDDLLALARSDSFAVALPACGFHLDARFADLRSLVDLGAAVALASNFNPGSAPCPSIPMAIALAVRHCGLTPAEAIAAATVNPATLLGLHDRGVIAPGARADLLLLRHTDERALAYEFGAPHADLVLVAGRIVHQA